MLESLRKIRHAALVGLLPLLLTGTAAAKEETRALRYPSLTPDGKQVVFCYRGDVWVAPVDGSSQALRLTIHEEQETLTRVSPDGKQIAFSSKRAGGYDLYVVPITGGEPKRVTFHSAPEILSDWSPDGKKLLFMSSRDAGEGRLDLYEIDLKGGTPRRITFDGGRDGNYSADGTKIVYIRGFNSIYWDNYKGSANYDIYWIDAKGGMPHRVTDTDDNERYPYFASDAKTIYFVAEEKGVANFYSMPVEGGKRTQLTKLQKNDVHRPDMNWDHKTVVFEVVGKLHMVDLTAAKDGARKIKLKISSDVRSSGVEVRTITSGGEQVHVSRDGSRVCFVLRGDIWTMPAGGGTATRLTSGPATDQWPRFSPDGKSIAYFSNSRGNNDLYLLDLASSKSRALTSHPADEFFQNWSPDGRHLVFCSVRSGNKDLYLLGLESGQVRQLTKHPAGDDDPSFSPDGKSIVFDSGRNGSQAIYVMNVDGTNVRRVTQGPMNVQVPSFSPDGKFIVYEQYVPNTGRGGGLYVIAASGGASMQIARDGSTACWSPKGDYIYFTANRGPHGDGVFRVLAPTSVVAGERVPFIGRVEVDRRKELGDVFDGAWGALKNGFYDKKMHRVDWDAMKRKYRDMAIDAENKDEFHNVIRQMLAELGASHLGIGGGQRDTGVPPTVKETGQLGLDFDQAPRDDGARKVVRLTAGGPADKAGLRHGDVVVKINKIKLKGSTDLDKVLGGTVDKEIDITFRPHSATGLGVERAVKLTPVSWMALRNLRYEEWQATCARRVKEATKTKDGEVAYLHLSQMNPQNLAKFQQAVARWNRNKKIQGMVLDVRNNGGGNIHQQLMQVLVSRPLARVFGRGMPAMVQPALYWDRPIVLLINERSFSDAEVFPYMYRAGGVGKIIGVPTAGGVIGTRNITLSDGSSFRVPRTGFRGMDGTNLEGLGVHPDIVVEETSEDRLTGRDPQLAKAIEVIQKEIAERKKAAAAKKKAEKAKKKAEEPKKPEAKPEPKPAPKPKAEPKPVTAAANGANHPLADARVGEWVRYRFHPPGAEGPSLIKVTVVRVANGTVQFEQEIEKGPGVLLPLPDRMRQVEVLELLPMFGKLLSTSHDPNGKVRDQETDILYASVEWPDGSKIYLSITNLVPAYGVWKVELENQVILEAIEWGQPERPEIVKDVEGGAPTPEPRPEPRPEPKPEPKPAPAAPAEKADAPAVPAHPIYDAKVGEWVKIRNYGPNDQSRDTMLTVTEVLDDAVVLKIAVEIAGRTMERDFRRPRQKVIEAPPNYADPEYGKETVRVGDVDLDCTTLTATRDDGGEIKLWFCPKVPVHGLVRVERDGEIVTELLEWGTE